jgi:hypothetical protein
MNTTLFSTAYFAPIQYYWHWRRAEKKTVEICEHYIKQTWRNRCVIGTANGPMTLSLPVEGNAEKTVIRDVRLSNHGNWQHLHWNSMESAYNSSPFFEYYADDLRPFFEKKPGFLLDFNEDIREIICGLLEIDASAERTTEFVPEREIPDEWVDLRNSIHPKKMVDPLFKPETYYQVFDRKFGFQPNLSILDLLFNMGPEAILYL